MRSLKPGLIHRADHHIRLRDQDISERNDGRCTGSVNAFGGFGGSGHIGCAARTLSGLEPQDGKAIALRQSISIAVSFVSFGGIFSFLLDFGGEGDCSRVSLRSGIFGTVCVSAMRFGL